MLKAPEKREAIFYVRTTETTKAWWEKMVQLGKWKSMADFFEAQTRDLQKREESHVGKKK